MPAASPSTSAPSSRSTPCHSRRSSMSGTLAQAMVAPCPQKCPRRPYLSRSQIARTRRSHFLRAGSAHPPPRLPSWKAWRRALKASSLLCLNILGLRLHQTQQVNLCRHRRPHQWVLRARHRRSRLCPPLKPKRRPSHGRHASPRRPSLQQKRERSRPPSLQQSGQQQHLHPHHRPRPQRCQPL